MYPSEVPKLWTDSIAEHRNSVRDAVLDATAALVDDAGPSAVTMAAVAARAGIGRATLYKYFPHVDAVLLAWHERLIEGHLRRVEQVRDRLVDPGHRLEAVLSSYANGLRHDGGATAPLHRGAHVAHAQQRLAGLIADLIVDAAGAHIVRDDVPVDEQVRYCLAALGAAHELPDAAAVRRLVDLVLRGLRPQT